MNPPGPLRANLSRYRRRKLPLDERAVGIEYPRFRGRIERPVRVSEIARGPGDSTYNNAPQPIVYDPGVGPYRFESPDYDQPEPWHGAAALGAPSPPPSPALNVDMQQHMDPPVDHDLAGWLLRRFVNDGVREAEHGNVDIHELFDPERTVRLKIGEIHDHCERIDAYESSMGVGNLIREMGDSADVQAGPDAQTPVLSDELAASGTGEPLPGPFKLPGGEAMPPDEVDARDAFSLQDLEAMPFGHELAPEAGIAGPDHPVGAIGLPDTGMDPMSSAPELTYAAPDQLEYGMPMEDIVEDEMQEMGPYGMMDPCHSIGPYGPLPDPRMMGMPMDPFGPMPPGSDRWDL